MEALITHCPEWLLALALLLPGSSTALVHSWYPIPCCIDKDCRPSVEESGETVTESAEGWKLWNGRTIAQGIAKLSRMDLRYGRLASLPWDG
jgi:hypothetical protein